MAAVLEELGTKLTDIAGIKVTFPVKEDKNFILKIYGRLCLMYDETWECGDSLSCKKIMRCVTCEVLHVSMLPIAYQFYVPANLNLKLSMLSSSHLSNNSVRYAVYITNAWSIY